MSEAVITLHYERLYRTSCFISEISCHFDFFVLLGASSHSLDDIIPVKPEQTLHYHQLVSVLYDVEPYLQLCIVSSSAPNFFSDTTLFAQYVLIFHVFLDLHLHIESFHKTLIISVSSLFL